MSETVELTIYSLPLFVVAFNQLIKSNLEADYPSLCRWIPVLAIIEGLVAVWFLFPSPEPIRTVLTGLTIGFAGGGLFGFGKATVLNK